jgi:hypothetical protein
MANLRRRKRFNRYVKLLSEIYNREYREVMRYWVKANGDIEQVRVALNLTAK